MDEQRVTTTEPTSVESSALESKQLAIYDIILTISQAHHAQCTITEDKVKTIVKRPHSLVSLLRDCMIFCQFTRYRYK